MDAHAKPSQSLSRRRAESLDRIKVAARKLFIERGYHAARPQDIAREAGLGHGTFYLHFEDKRACFLSFVDDARAEYHCFIRSYIGHPESIEEVIDRMLEAVYIFSDKHPGLLKAAMADEALIDAEGPRGRSMLQGWGRNWAFIMREASRGNERVMEYDPNIVGQAILGAIQQGKIEGDRRGMSRADVIYNLRSFLLHALKH